MRQLRLVSPLALLLLCAGCAATSCPQVPPPAPLVVKDVEAAPTPNVDPSLFVLPAMPLLPDPDTIKADDGYVPALKALVADDLVLRMNIQAIQQEEAIRSEK